MAAATSTGSTALPNDRSIASAVDRRGDGSGGTDKDAVWEKSESAFNSKQSSKFYDPCQEFANKSIKCMHRNNGDKDMCQDYFQAYRDCKKEWMEQRRAAKKGWFGS